MSAQDTATAAAAQAAGRRNATEAAIQRNPHGDFGAVEAGRPEWDSAAAPRFTKSPAPGWQWGQGGNDGGASLATPHVEIDPYAAGRPSVSNYKLLISAIIPRPIGLLSTAAADGSAANLAPFSYTNVVNHDPPIFTLGIAGGLANAKDTLANLATTKECESGRRWRWTGQDRTG